MKLFGLEILGSKSREALVAKVKQQTLSAVNAMSGGWFNILESFGGAFQRVISVDSPRNLLAFSAVFSCVTIIASDVAKLRVKLVKQDSTKGGIWVEVTTNNPRLPVLRKPNRFQNRIKFYEQWIVSKLLYGNTYALKLRDARGIVTSLYILDAQRVTPLVADNGDIYYRLSADFLSELPGPVTVPASEIIHDTMVALWHPLIGVSPIYACGMSATMGNKIQANSTKFFDNMSRPSGILTAPETIPDETAIRLKKDWEENFGSNNLGRLAVLGDGLTYEAMTIPAGEAQLIEQLKWTVEDVARCFHMPLYKIGGPIPVRNTLEALDQTYYSDCLQALIESAELCLAEGLELPTGYAVEFDLAGLLRMDTQARYLAKGQAVKDGWMCPDEARIGENLAPVPGGDTPYLQMQNFSLGALAKRDAQDNPFKTDAGAAPPGNDGGSGSGTPAAANDETAADEQAAAALAGLFIKGLEPEHV